MRKRDRNRFDGLADARLPGSDLRNQVAHFLSSVYGNARVEQFVLQKKIDVVCVSSEFGKPTTIFVEVKDWKRNLSGNEVANIAKQYEHILAAHPSSKLLLVTRVGLAPTASAFVDHQPRIFHQTIWDLEDSVLSLTPYLNSLRDLFDADGLSGYYIPARARATIEFKDDPASASKDNVDLLSIILSWLDAPGEVPLAILGSYGAGKTSFVHRLVSHLANEALENPATRRPILIKLGDMTRYASLDGLLGAMFAGEFEIRGYSFNRFREFNRAGRLVVILDGFDEMKHAMAWTEFRNFMAEVNELVTGEAKIIILGRPAAFISEGEYFELLRGISKTARSKMLLGLLKFDEIELAPFTDDERRAFVAGFVRHGESLAAKRASRKVDDIRVTKRIDDVNAVADQEPDIFRKPVHARMLAELAIGGSVDLASLKKNVGRWTLYRAFFSYLARRETTKPARSPIDEEDRNKFARQLAWWMWTAREGYGYFASPDLPEEIFIGLARGDTNSLEEMKREYLSGAPLECKAGEIYYFAHRSFLEFLVAEHLAMHAAERLSHPSIAAAVRGGVGQFLLEPAPRSRVQDWVSTLQDTRGVLSVDYLVFLASASGGWPALMASLQEESPWNAVVRAIAVLVGGGSPEELAEIVYGSSSEGVLLVLSLVAQLRNSSERVLRGQVAASKFFDIITPAVVAALLARTIGFADQIGPDSESKTAIEKGLLEVTLKAVSLGTRWSQRIVIVSWGEFERATAQILERIGLGVETRSARSADNEEVDLVRVSYEVVGERLSPSARQNLDRVSPRHGKLQMPRLMSGPATGR